MVKKFQIFTIKHFGHRGFGAPNGSSVEILPLWKEAYAGEVHEFDSEYDAERFLRENAEELKGRQDYIVLPVYKL